MRARRLLACILVGVSAAGCSSLDSLNPFSSSTSDKTKPTPLAPFTATAELKLQWEGSAGAAGDYVFTPAVVGSSVYAAGHDGTLVRFDDGRQVWRISAGQPLSAGVGADSNLAVVGTPKGEVLAFDSGGKPLWKARVSSEVLSAPSVVGELVVVRSGDNRIFGFDARDGKRRWTYQRSAPPLTLRSAAGVAVTDRAVLAGFPGGKLVAISASNGAALWEATVALPRGATELERVADVIGVPVLGSREVCAVAYQGRVACFELANGNLLWAKDLSSTVGLDVDGRYLYVTDDRGWVHAFERTGGASVWRTDKLAYRGVTRPVAFEGHVAVADRQGVVHLLRQDDGAFAARVNAGSSPVFADPRRTSGGIVVQSETGALYAFALR